MTDQINIHANHQTTPVRTYKDSRLIQTIFAGLIAVIFAVPQPSAAESNESKPGTDDLKSLARTIAERVSKMRGLELKHPVKVGIKTKKQLRALLKKELNTQFDASQLEAEGAVLEALGLIPDSSEYKQILLDVFTEQIAGFYDEKEDQLFLMDRMSSKTRETVLAHEIFHGLQDQHFSLETMMNRVDSVEHADAELATQALVEGDATLLMLDYVGFKNGLLPHENIRSFADMPAPFRPDKLISDDVLFRNATMDGSGLGAGLTVTDTGAFEKAPAVLQAHMLFPYLGGLRFILSLKERGSWEAIDRLYDKPPTSTEQILHPEKYIQNDSPTTVYFQLRRPESEPMYNSMLGEFLLRFFLLEHLAKKKQTRTPASKLAKKAAAGWDGDRLLAYQQAGGPDPIVGLTTVWDTEKDARQFFDAASKLLEIRHSVRKAKTRESGAYSTKCVLHGTDERPEVSCVERAGEFVLMLDHFYPESPPPDASPIQLTETLRRQVWHSKNTEPFSATLKRARSDGSSE